MKGSNYSKALALAASIGFVAHARAQTAVTDNAAESAPALTLQEVVVTATRRETTVHDVPMSMTAVTNQAIEALGLKTAQDLVQTVPSLYISPTNGGNTGGFVGNPSVAIRGINAEGTGAATTGIYIDDIPLQQRNTLGSTSGGTVFPQLFDLERVEVLRGPQGTLYGGSSEGGTIRFITPQPSFTETALNTRLEGSGTQGGNPNAEGGVTFGGPVVSDTLAARVSLWYRHDGGYIDHVSRFTGAEVAGGDNTNSSEHRAVTAALAWKPLDGTLVTLKYLYFNNSFRDSDNYWQSIPRYQAYVGPGTPGTAYTYCPCNFAPYQSGQNTNVGDNFYQSDAQLAPSLSPHADSLSLPALTIDYATSTVDIKLVSAYAKTINSGVPDFSYVDTASRALTPLEAPYNSLPNSSSFIADLPLYSSRFAMHGQITDWTEELRLTSADPQARFSWVAGAFYDLTKMHSLANLTSNTGDLAAAVLLGQPSSQGSGFEGLNGLGFVSGQEFTEQQAALYAQGTAKITQQLRLIAGVRATRDQFSYSGVQGGALFGFAPGELAPAAAGTVTQTPVTPLVGLQYFPTPPVNLYATASKGYRSGGVNTIIPPACESGLAQLGYQSSPNTYASDSLWSYEVGSKVRAFQDRASIDISAYYIDWKGVQTSVGLACGSQIILNAAKAVSRGLELQGNLLVAGGLSLTLNAGYTDAHYAQAVSSDTALLINDGDRLPYTPQWTGNLGAQYRFKLLDRSAYVRADYSYQGPVVQGTGPGTATYQPDAYRLPNNRNLNMRAGVNLGAVDVDLFVNNLTASRDVLGLVAIGGVGPGRYGCFSAGCDSYLLYAQGGSIASARPRTIGVDFTYRLEPRR